MFITKSSVRRLKLLFTSFCVLAASLSGGGVFILPLLIPSIAIRLHVAQISLTPVILAGLMGQYIFAVGWGVLMDRVGTWACSMCGALLFSLGFGLFERILIEAPPTPAGPTVISWLAFAQFLVGLGTTASYFGFLFASCKNYPRYNGLATGVPLSIFGLSPLFLSTIVTSFFLDTSTGVVDSSRSLTFLAIFTGTINVVGFFGLRIWDSEETAICPPALSSDGQSLVNAEITEEAPLLPPQISMPFEQNQSALSLLGDSGFWGLVFIMLTTTGACEMVMANIGNIVLALMPDQPSLLPSTMITSFLSDSPLPSLATRQLHINLISIFNTGSRVLTGFLADRYSTSSDSLSSVTRMLLVSCAAASLAGAFAWTALGLTSERSLWVLTVVVGSAYGTIFTAAPGITASVWGSRSLGRNWGIVSYSPLFGTPLLTYLYKFVSDSNGEQRGCEGVHCFRPTFAACSVISVVAAFCSFLLLQRWRAAV